MAKTKGYVLSVALLSSGVLATWKLLLDDRAKTSVRRMAQTLADAANGLVGIYMGAGEAQQATVADDAVKANQDWIDWQWKNAGF